MRIAVCDVGLGNLRSVERGLLEASRGHDVRIEISSDPRVIAAADKIVMPGQGGFGDCARALSAGLRDSVLAHLAKEKPYFGICLGLQVLLGTSEEAPGCSGLGVVEGSVVRLAGGVDPLTGAKLKIPHVGWNAAEPTAGVRALLPEAEHFYFVHSFAVAPRDPRVIAATTEYGARFVSAIAYGNVFACQFHPEKSQRAGIALLERFVRS
ncbi:MAG TPA: imidazole glycerol phosphate synthase subunit HisH [Polyangiaceae bacterium]|nr:imidazole glycerol phosphate synthase subunit HisH [Polyangiaceae bacterium]